MSEATVITTPKRRNKITLECCCCGGGAPAYSHWWNRDTGYGLCGKCATMIKARPDYDPAEFRQSYGDAYEHWIPCKQAEPPIESLDAYVIEEMEKLKVTAAKHRESASCEKPRIRQAIPKV